MYTIEFYDCVWGDIEESFDNYEDALEYWEQYKDTPTCINGCFYECETGETVHTIGWW